MTIAKVLCWCYMCLLYGVRVPMYMCAHACICACIYTYVCVMHALIWKSLLRMATKGDRVGKPVFGPTSSARRDICSRDGLLTASGKEFLAPALPK